jgi:hypothetical protein
VRALSPLSDSRSPRSPRQPPPPPEKQNQNQTQNREGYTLEGTKKQGISPKRRAKLLAKARESAAAAAAAKS